MKTRWLSSVGAAIALALIMSVASAGRGAASNGPSVLSFTDPAGDASGAPDITGVTITGDATAGMISFAVTATGLEPASADGSSTSVDLFLNTDRNRSTGSPDGDEYDLYVWSESPNADDWYWDVERWNGSTWQEVAQSATMHAYRSGDVFTIAVGTADLAGATSLAVRSLSFAWDASQNLTARDDATGSLSWVYDITGPSRTMTTLAFPTIGTPKAVPAQLAAGKRVTVSFPVTWTPNGTKTPLAAGTMVCDPSVAGKVIAHAESFRGGTARLTFIVPNSAKSKQVKVKVTIKAPSMPDKQGVWIDIRAGEQGILATQVAGQSTTRIALFRVR